MEILTKFNRLDQVCYMFNNQIYIKIVYSISANVTDKGIFIGYYIGEWTGTKYEPIEDLYITESKLFSSREELIKSL